MKTIEKFVDMFIQPVFVACRLLTHIQSTLTLVRMCRVLIIFSMAITSTCAKMLTTPTCSDHDIQCAKAMCKVVGELRVQWWHQSSLCSWQRVIPLCTDMTLGGSGPVHMSILVLILASSWTCTSQSSVAWRTHATHQTIDWSSTRAAYNFFSLTNVSTINHPVHTKEHRHHPPSYLCQTSVESY